MKNKVFNLMLICMMMIVLSLSCNKEEEPDVKDDSKEVIKENIKLLNETSANIEKALAAGDQTAFMNFINPAYQKYYKDAVQKNQNKLAQFAEVFKTRKLIKCDGYFAVYQVQYNGKWFEITMIFDDDKNWRLKDL